MRRMIFSPNRPSGRNSRNTSASTYGNQPSMPPPKYGPMFGGGIEGWAPYMLAVLFLLYRAEGLFGEKIIRRV